MADSAYVLHLLHRVEHDIEFLQEQGALSYEDAALITTKLKEAEVLNLPAAAAPSAASASRGGSQSNGSRVADLSRQMSGMSVGGSKVGRSVPPPPAAAASAAAAAAGTGAVASEAGVVGIGKARAVWDYVKVQPDDLGFKKGDVIVLLEESNADWWKGQIGDRVGLFPANHVERLASPAPCPPALPPAGRFVPPPPPHTPPSYSSAPAYPSSQNQHYGEPEKSEYAHQQQPYGQAVQPWQHAQPVAGPAYGAGAQQQVALQPGQEGEQAPKKRFGGRLGGQMASAAAGGVGFGAGAAVGSGIINAIF